MVHKWSMSLAARGLLLVTSLALCSAAFGQRLHYPKIVASVDTSAGQPTADEVKELNDIANKAAETGRRYYPMIVRLIGAEKNYMPKTVTITITYSYRGVAGTDNDHTDVSATYALRHPDDIPGVIVHEFTHVVQHYQGQDIPGWLVEGIADYVRWFNYEPVNKRPHPHGPKADARNAYQTTAAFLDWAVNKYDRDLVKQLNQECYDGTYTEDSWKTLTGKSLDDLDAEWKATLPP